MSTESRFLVEQMQEYRGVSGSNDKGAQETLGDDGFVPYLDRGDDPWAFTYVKTHQLVQFKYVQLIACELYLNSFAIV